MSVSAIAIPDDVKARIALDRRRPAWIVTDEANMFTWPGFDLIPQRDGGFVRGMITRGFLERIRDALLRGHTRTVDRD
jgi:hypothetical protein